MGRRVALIVAVSLVGFSSESSPRAGDGSEDTDRKGATCLISGVGMDAPSWAPDGSRIAVDGGDNFGVKIVSTRSPRIVSVTEEILWKMVSWSPREDLLAYIESEHGGLWIKPITEPASPPREILAGSDLEGYEDPWSPDGRFLLIQRANSLYRIEVATGEATMLLSANDLYWTVFQAAWSPDGDEVVACQRHDVLRLRARDGKTLERLSLNCQRAQIGKDRSLWVGAIVDGEADQLVHVVDGVASQPLGTERVTGFDVDRLTGRLVAAVSGRGLVLLDTSGAVIGTVATGAHDHLPRFSPDAKAVAWIRWSRHSTELCVGRVD